MADTQSNRQLKLCIIGDADTGKTTFLFRLKKDDFEEKYIPTIMEAENMPYKFKGQNINLSLWDTAGQEDLERIRVLSYDNLSVLVVSFSLVRQETFENVKNFWKNEIEENKEKFKDTKIVLIGTKADLKKAPGGIEQPGEAPISREMGERLAKEINAVGYVETSAKTGDGVHEAVKMGLEAALKEIPTNPHPYPCCSII